MGTTYTRQSTFIDGDTITAALFNDEYDQLVTAFSYASTSTTGHQHDGTAAEGGNVHTIGDQDFLNKIVADSTNNRWGIFVQVSSSAVEQIRISDGVISPVTDNDIDLGTSSLEFKDLFIDGTAHVDTLDVDVNGTVTGTFGVTGATTLSSTLAVTGAVTGSSTLQGTTITATTAFVPDASDGAALGTSALEFSDLFLADGAVINFGDDQDVSLTHVVDTGLLISSTDQLQFGDSGTYIYQSADGVLDLVSDTEIEINATTIDINGNVDVSGTLTVAGAVDFGDAALSNVGAVQLDSIAGDGDTDTSITFSGSNVITIKAANADQVTFTDGAIVPSTDNDIDLGTSSTEFKDAFFDGTVTSDAFAGPLTGDVTGNVSGTAATVTTAAQTNITSLGTLTALTVDDVAINGKVVTMTGSSSDTAVLTAGTNGTLSIVTTDDAAAAANIQITADGTVDIDSAGVLTLDSGAAINIEPAAGSAILLDGTISVDAGVVTGATSITSTAFVGALTGNASGTAATVTTAAQSSITSLGTLTTLTIDSIIINGTNIGHTSDTDSIAIASNGVVTFSQIPVFPADTIDSSYYVDGSIDLAHMSAESIDSDQYVDGSIDTAHIADNQVTLAKMDGLARGKIIYGDSSGDPAALAVGSANYVLTSDGTDISWGAAATGTTFQLEDDDGTEVTISDSKEVKFIGSGITTNWTDTDNGTDGDPYDLTFTVDAAQTGITSVYATDLIMGEDSQTAIDFGTANEIDFKADNAARLTLTSSALYPVTDNEIDLGTSSLEFKDAFFDGTVTADAFAGPLTGDVTGNASGTAATVTTAAQSSITSLGTLTTLTIDSIIINGTNIGHTSDTDSIAIASDGVVTFSQIPVLPANTIDSDHYVDGSIDNAHIADDAIDSEHYADGSIDNAHIADDQIDSEHYVDGSIDTAHLADDAVSLAKMASGTDGNIISYDASGNPVAIATGNDGQVLTSTGAGSPPAFEAASGGATDLDGLTDALVEGTSIYLGNDPSGTTSTAEFNVSLGTTAMDAITTGDKNTAVGYGALGADNVGYFCTAIGMNALSTQSVGGHTNTCIGYNAGLSATVGSMNVFIGTRSAENQAGAGNQNVVIGQYSASTLTTGDQNIVIGSDANVSTADAQRQIVLGYSVNCAGDNKITVGSDTNIATLDLDGSDEAWAASSDERLKENITTSTAGLSFINDLRPVTYNWKKAGEVPEDMPQYKAGSEEPCLGLEYGKTQHGFIAQEVKTAIDNHSEIKEGFNMWQEYDNGTQATAKGNVIPMLVKAVQELSAEVEQLKQQQNNGE